MELFYIIVLGVAVVILIIILAIIGIGMRNNKGSGEWPPVEATCPDYWTLDASGNCMIPKNGSRNVGSIYSDTTGDTLSPSFTATTKGYSSSTQTTMTPSINFNDPYYITCNKQKWAKTNGIYWDGYSNYSNCPAT
jgi:hypothetical protein